MLLKKINLTLFHIALIFIVRVSIGLSFELIQIHSLSRHGERSPVFSYSTDPHKHKWIKGLGQITDKGIRQKQELGQFLRYHYRQFLPKTYHKDDFYFRSSDLDRTISSGLAAMSTLFYNEIIPIHTVPKSYDYLLKMSSNCPHHKNLLSKTYESKRYASYISEYLQLFQLFEKYTGLPNVGIHKALKICDGILVWKQMNLTFPNWLNMESVNKCKRLSDMEYIISFSDVSLTRYRGGPLATNIVENMIKRVRSFLTDKSGLKMVGYFAHDDTIAAFLSHLGSFNGVKPPLASTVIVELYHDSQSIPIDDEPLTQFFVRLLFRNDTNIAPHILDISICRNNDGSVGHKNGYCRLDLLRNSLQPHKIEDFVRECESISIIDVVFKYSSLLALILCPLFLIEVFVTRFF